MANLSMYNIKSTIFTLLISDINCLKLVTTNQSTFVVININVLRRNQRFLSKNFKHFNC